MRPTRPADFILPYLIALIVFGVEYKLCTLYFLLLLVKTKQMDLKNLSLLKHICMNVCTWRNKYTDEADVLQMIPGVRERRV
jgi:hypothetical protein